MKASYHNFLTPRVPPDYILFFGPDAINMFNRLETGNHAVVFTFLSLSFEIEEALRKKCFGRFSHERILTIILIITLVGLLGYVKVFGSSG